MKLGGGVKRQQKVPFGTKGIPLARPAVFAAAESDDEGAEQPDSQAKKQRSTPAGFQQSSLFPAGCSSCHRMTCCLVEALVGGLS